MGQMMRRDLKPALTAFVFMILTTLLTVSSRAAERNPDTSKPAPTFSI